MAGCSSDSPTEPSPGPAPTGPVVYTAFAASDGLGIGSSVECLPFSECPNGMGYVQVIARTFRNGGRPVTLTNLALPAGVLSPRIQSLGRQYGRFIPGNFLEATLPSVSRDSTLVTIFAGANDANTIVEALERGAGGSNAGAFMDDQVRQFSAEYRQLVAGVRARAGQPRIVAANLPNLAGAPYAAGYPPARRQAMQTLTVRLTREAINTLTAEGVAVVDLMCDGRSYEPSRYSNDGFHPSDAGYAFIAELMLRAINEASFPAPQNDCSFMRIVS